MFDVAFSRRMCCSRVCSAIRYAGWPLASTDTPMMRPGACRTYASRVAKNAACGPAVPERHAEPLRVADDDVGAHLAGRREERQREQIGRDRHQHARLVRARDERREILDPTGLVGILQQQRRTPRR